MKKAKIVVILLGVLLLVFSGVSLLSAQGIAGTGWWANFTIQNVDSTTATTNFTAYHKTGGSSATYSGAIDLPPDTSAIFHPGLTPNCTTPFVSGCRVGLSPNLPAGFEGSVTVSSNAAIVAVANINNNPSGSVGVTGGTARSAYQGIGNTQTATTLYFPTVKHNFSGQTTIFFVQAAGSDANVTITYEMNDGTTHTHNQIIPANRMFAFHPASASPAVASCNGGNGGGSGVAPCFGGATVTSDQPVAGTVVEYIDGASIAGYVLSTRASTPADAGTTVLAPTMKYNFNGSSTGATILNTGASQATVDLSFSVTNTSGSCSNSPGDTATDQVTIDPGKSVVVNGIQGNIGGLNNCVFFSMQADSTQPIVVTVNENRVMNGQTVKAVYSGFNVSNGTTTAFLPLAKEYFNGQTTGVTVVNAGNAAATITGNYNCGSSSHTVTTASAIQPGAAASFFNLSGGNANFTAGAGGFPSAGSKCSVVMSSAEEIFALSQESDRNAADGTFDIYNVEGFNQ